MKNESRFNLKRGDVWLIKFKRRDSLGTEVYKTRPAIIFSVSFYNEESNRIIALPLTRTTRPLYKWEIPIVLNNHHGKVMVDQIRSFDKKERLIKKLGEVSDEVLRKAGDILNELVEIRH